MKLYCILLSFSESYEASIQVGGAVLEFLGLTKSDVLALKRSVRTRRYLETFILVYMYIVPN
jgi:hypothetical protein